MAACNHQALECNSGTSSIVTTDSTIVSRSTSKRSNSDDSCKSCNGARGVLEHGIFPPRILVNNFALSLSYSEYLPLFIIVG